MVGVGGRGGSSGDGKMGCPEGLDAMANAVDRLKERCNGR